jgi:flagellar biosynthetic protein FliR
MSEFEIILKHVPPALLVIFRIGGLMMYGPLFGSSVIPARVKVFLAFMTGIATYPLLSRQHFAGVELTLELWHIAPLMAMELLIGLIIGFVASLPLLAMQTGGLLMGQQMGLGFAQLYNPAIDDEGDIVGQMLFFMALAVFLICGGHEWMLLAVLNSFEHVPVGRFSVDLSMLSLVSGVLAASLELALRVAAPLLTLVFLETVAMGLLAKTVPQLNILSLGFPLRILAGLAITIAGLTIINDVELDAIGEAFQAISEWLESSGTTEEEA